MSTMNNQLIREGTVWPTAKYVTREATVNIAYSISHASLLEQASTQRRIAMKIRSFEIAKSITRGILSASVAIRGLVAMQTILRRSLSDQTCDMIQTISRYFVEIAILKRMSERNIQCQVN